MSRSVNSPLIVKLAALGAVLLILGAVVARIEGLVDERRMRQAEAAAGVAQSSAGPQVLAGPLLARHCVERGMVALRAANEKPQPTTREFTLIAIPSDLTVVTEATPEVRERGLFKVNAFVARSHMQARFDDLSALEPPPTTHDASGRITCNAPHVVLALSDVRGIRSAEIKAGPAGDLKALKASAGTGIEALPSGVQAPLATTPPPLTPLHVSLGISLFGTEHLALVPTAQQTQWSLASAWPHPSFGGRFLPVKREVSAAGFSALWQVSSLASSAAQAIGRSGRLCAQLPGMDALGDAAAVSANQASGCLDALAVTFIEPINPYSLADRASKYALLFIVLTFACVGLVEVLGQRRVHPVQYGLVGAALAIFFLLLLSLAEHLRFDAAYASASLACAALLAYYARHVLGGWRSGAAFGAGIALLYGLLWVLLKLEQTALAVGSVTLFAALAAVMIATRKVDWYGLSSRSGAQSPARNPIAE